MFGHDENEDKQQDQNHNTPASSAPLPDPAGTATHDDSSLAPATESSNTLGTIGSGLSTASPVGATDTPVPSDLLDIKQQALQHLTPLVGQLEQSPEEKFRTTMMMIQASDDQALVKDAYEAAKQITDEKARAQALLDVINEINYFTQQKK